MANIMEWTNSGAVLEARLIEVSKQRALSGIHCGLADTSLAIRDILAWDQALQPGGKGKKLGQIVAQFVAHQPVNFASLTDGFILSFLKSLIL